jgi:O-antigen ligase
MFSRFKNHLLSANTSALMIALMVFVPFVIPYHRLPIPSFYGEWIAMVLGVIALLPMLKRTSWQPIEIPHFSLIFLGFIAIVCMQAMLGMVHSTSVALLIIAYLVWAMTLSLLGRRLRVALGWEKLTSYLSWAIVAGGFLNAVFVTLQFMGKLGVTLPLVPQFVGYGALGQVNHFGNYIALGIASILYLYANRRLRFAYMLPMLILFMAMLAFSGSRSAWLYLAALTIIAIGMQVNAIRQQSGSKDIRSLLRTALVLLPLFAFVQWLVAMLFGDLVTLPNDRLMSELSGEVAVGGIAMRLHIWYESLLLFMQSPWLGVGVGQTRWMSFSTLDANWSVNMPGMYEHAHNIVIHLMAEMGVAGALLILAGVFAWLRGFQWKNMHLETWWLIAVLSIIAIHSLLEYPLWYAYFLGMTAFLFGAGDENIKKLRLNSMGSVTAFSVIAVGLIALNLTLIANSKLQYCVDRTRMGKVTVEDKEKIFNALEWVDQHSLLSPYATLMFANVLPNDGKRLDEKIAMQQQAMRFVIPYSLAYKHVLALELNGQHTQAVVAMQYAIQAYPHHFKEALQKIPRKYWDIYLAIFAEAIAPNHTAPNQTAPQQIVPNQVAP